MKRVMLALLVVAAVSGHAQTFMSAGAGATISCGAWLESRSTPGSQYIGRANWALGFVSGAAWTGRNGDPFARVDADGFAYWLDNYCRANPSVKFRDAVVAFINAHGSRR